MGHFTPEQPLHCPHWSLLWLTLSSRYSSVLLPVLDSYLQFTPVPIDSHQFHHLSITFKQLFCTSSLQSDILKPGFDFNCTYNLGFASELHSQLWSHSLPQSRHQSCSRLWFQHRFQAWTCWSQGLILSDLYWITVTIAQGKDRETWENKLKT